MNIVELKDISKYFGSGDSRIDALKNINLNISQGDMVSITGKSGSGKSTLLNILGGLDTPSSGEYLFEGRNINGLNQNALAEFRCKNIGFIVQHFALINDITVFENVALPLRYQRIPKQDIEIIVKYILKEMDLTEKINSYPNQLSGGQCQRVAISRGLACNPKLLLVDEPTGSLDEKTGLSILEVFKKLNKQGISIIIATHDSFIANSCKRIFHLKDGELSK